MSVMLKALSMKNKITEITAKISITKKIFIHFFIMHDMFILIFMFKHLKVKKYAFAYFSKIIYFLEIFDIFHVFY